MKKCNCQEAEKEALIAGQETLQKYLAGKEAEIERLRDKIAEYPNRVLCDKGLIFTKSLAEYDELINDIASEAIKEFAEAIKSYIDAYVVFEYAAGEQNLLDYIDNLVKEMVGEGK